LLKINVVVSFVLIASDFNSARDIARWTVSVPALEEAGHLRLRRPQARRCGAG
jgi:hypothetical protein